MKSFLFVFMFLLAISAGAQLTSKTYQLSDAPRYSDAAGYGFDLMPSPNLKNKKPFYFSVKVPDGNYKVTVRLGSKKQAGITTVRAESRRLFLTDVRTKKGQFIEKSFIVNKRDTLIRGLEFVRIKPREREKLNWDNKLTLEFNGSAPVCESVKIEPADPSVVTVFLCGNSTVVDQDNEPWASWGQMIPAFFNNTVCFANYAESGESSNTFLAAGRLKKALTQMKKGDYIFMEFGHNDEKQRRPGSGAWYSYMYSLKIYIDEARRRGAYPVIVTPTQRRRFGTDGKLVPTHGEYPDAARWIAKKENVPLIDLTEMTTRLFNAMGEEGSKRAFVHYPASTFPGQEKAFADNTHFNPYGAFEIAKCVVTGIEQALPALSESLKEPIRFDPSKPDPISQFHWDLSPFTEVEKPDGN